MSETQSEPAQPAQRSSFSLWMQAVRPFAFSASITPVLLGTALAYFEQGVFHVHYFLAAMFGGVLLHSGTNLVSEYYDLIKGADKLHTFGSSRVLVDNLMEPKRVLRGGLACFGVAFLIGIYLALVFGLPIVVLGIIGLLGGFFYTGAPLGYKYKALGEPLVFTLMGPLMVLGAYFVQIGQLSWTPVIVSIPISILVAGILNANNLRDIPHDKEAGFVTIPGLLGWSTARIAYHILIISAYVSLIVMVIAKVVPIWSLVALITIIPSLKLHKIAGSAQPMTPSDLAVLDVSTAQLHLQFGLLSTIGVVMGRLL